MTEKDCLFCKIARREIPAQIVYEDQRLLVFRDVKPQAPVHLLLIPKHHVATLFELAASDENLAGALVLEAAALARREGLEKDGFRLVANCLAGAGQSVFHIHFHLLGGRPLSWPPG